MLKVKPSYVLLIGILSNIVYILIKDTKSKHNLPIIPINQWTLILLVFLLASMVSLLWNYSSNYQNNLLSYAMILSIPSSVLFILEISFSSLGYRTILNLISFLTLLSLVKVQSAFSRIYLGLYLIVFLDFQTLLYDSISSHIGINVMFEGLFIFGLIFYIYKSNLVIKELAIVGLSGLIGIILSLFVLSKDTGENDEGTALLIFRQVIQQLLGIREFAVDLTLFEVTKDMVFVIHVTEFLVLAVVLILNRPSALLVTILLTGFNMTYPPLAGFRAAAIMYQFNRYDQNVNSFDFIQR